MKKKKKEIISWSGDMPKGVAHVERTPNWREGDLRPLKVMT